MPAATAANTTPLATADQPFIHRPRPAIGEMLGEGTSLEISVCHYGSASALKAESGGGFRVMRNQDVRRAGVTLTSTDCWSATVRANPAELREMAARLIDAAADIEASFAVAAAAAQEAA